MVFGQVGVMQRSGSGGFVMCGGGVAGAVTAEGCKEASCLLG